jgi:PAS domain S-box-containing protein
MTPAPILSNEQERLNALLHYNILDTPNTPEFDDFTRLASEICGTPIALISLIDADRQWFKSKVGLDAEQTPRDISFCGHAIHQTELFEVPNALDDDRFRDNPLVTGAPDIRFYAGQPLVTAAGFGIGTLCVIDRVPHTLNATQRDLLKVLGRLIVQQLDLHHTVEKGHILNDELNHQLSFRKALLDSAGMAVITTNRQGVITGFNLRAERILGYAASEVIGKATLNGFINGHESEANVARELRPDFDAFLDKVREHSHQTREYSYRRKDGRLIPVELTVSAIREDHKTITGYLGLALDISERKLIENTKSEFISVVSHELRTPLTSIRASLGLLEAGVLGPLHEKALNIVKIANRNSQRLITLVNDILDMDKLMSGKMTIHANRLNLVKLVEQSIEANEGYATTFEVRFVMTDLTKTKEVVGDADRLTQVMANLLSNAAKFSPPHAQIEVRVLNVDNLIKVEVEDHGAGIPLEFQPHIFGKFEQADTGNTRQHGGTGLGLNISYKLMEKMHGQIGFNTTIGKGTVFWITLPVAAHGAT